MRNAKLVPICVAPDDPHARAVGDALDTAFRREISALCATMAVPPQPRWLFRDIADGRSMSAAQLFRAFAILAQCAEIPTARVLGTAEALMMMLRGLRPDADASLEALHLEETRAQADADVLQLQATVSGGRDQSAVARALEATSHHQAVASRYASRLASLMLDPPRTRPARVVARSQAVASVGRGI